MALHSGHAHKHPASRSVNPVTALGLDLTAPTHRLFDTPVPAEAAWQIVHDELMLDGNARLNLATFVTTWMEPQAAPPDGRVRRQEHDRQGRVPADGRARAALRQHPRRPVERPRTHRRDRHAPRPARARPACWPGWRSSGGGGRAGSRRSEPNLVMGANVQVCWEKFCNYWEVEPRLVPMEGDRYPPDGRGGRQALRREHHRRRRGPRVDVRRFLRAGRGDLRGARRPAGRGGARTSRCTSTGPPGR